MGINSKSTKAEILAAYKDLEKEKKSLEVEMKQNISKNTNNLSISKNISQTIQVDRVLEMIQKQIQDRDILNIIKVLEQLQIGFGGAVSSLSEQLITEATTLEKIRELIAEEQQQLTELYDLKGIKDSTIEELIKQYQINYQEFSEESEVESENKHQEIAELIKTWNKEQEVHKHEIQVRNKERKKTQQREIEEYQYNLDLARDLDEDKYEQENKERYQALDTIRQELEEQWQIKEKEIFDREQEYIELKKQVAEFEEKLRKKIKQGEEEGKEIGTYQAKVKQDLRRKEIEGEHQNYKLHIQSLEQNINDQETRIAKLTQQLDTAKSQVQDLAVKAIEGTASRQSYEVMKEIAMEQAKTQQKSK